MPKLTNNTNQSIELKVGIKDGVVQMEAIPAGETRNVNVAADDMNLIALLNAKALSTEDKRVAKAVEAAAAPSA